MVPPYRTVKVHDRIASVYIHDIDPDLLTHPKFKYVRQESPERAEHRAVPPNACIPFSL